MEGELYLWVWARFLGSVALFRQYLTIAHRCGRQRDPQSTNSRERPMREQLNNNQNPIMYRKPETMGRQRNNPQSNGKEDSPERMLNEIQASQL